MDIRSVNPGDLGGPVVSGLELRDALNGTFTDVDEGTRQVKVEFPHETVDSYKTVFGNRAFKDSFAQRQPTMCWQHQLNEPIGHALKAQVTPRHNEIVGQFSDFDAVPLAHRAFSQIEDGTITDFSFGFKNASYEPAPTLGKGVRRITKAFMAEFSPVTIGSIPGAKAVGLREDGETATMDIEQILYLRDQKIVTPEGFRALMIEHHPEIPAEHIYVRDIKGNDGDADDFSGSASEDEIAPVEWTAVDSGLHTATGPNGEDLSVNQNADGTHGWKVVAVTGDITEGSAADRDAAKQAAEEATMERSDQGALDVPDTVTADDIRAVVAQFHPAMAAVIADCALALGAPGEQLELATRGEGDIIAASLVVATDAAIDSAAQWFERADADSLPDEVQQGIALVTAARISVDAAVDAMGVQTERAAADEDEDDDTDEDTEDNDDGDLDDEEEKKKALEAEEAKKRAAQALAVLDRRLSRAPITVA